MLQIDSITILPLLPTNQEFSYQVYASPRMEEIQREDWATEQKESFLLADRSWKRLAEQVCRSFCAWSFSTRSSVCMYARLGFVKTREVNSIYHEMVWRPGKDRPEESVS